MSSLALFALGGSELFFLVFLFILVPVPLYVVYRVGYNKGKHEGRLDAEAISQY